MKKGILLCIGLAVILLSVCVGCSEKQTMTGNEWLLKQSDCFTDLEEFANGMDEVYSLYIMGSISKQDFVNELYLLKQQYKILTTLHNHMKDDNPIEPESHSYLSKVGTQAIEDLYISLGDILDNTLDENGKPYSQEQTSYLYLAYRQVVSGYITEYLTAVAWYKEAQGEYDNIK